MAKKEISYKEAIAEIEQILASIEDQEPDVDALTGKVKRVAFLLSLCKEKLYTTRQEVENILKEIEEEE